MTTPTEYWEVNFVQYKPNQEEVLLGGHFTVVTASGKKVTEFQNVKTTQHALLAEAPEGATTWGDDEVAAIVEAATGVPCMFYEPPAPEPFPES